VTLSIGPLTAGFGWGGWVIVAVIVVAFWAVPIAATLALIPARRNRGQQAPRSD
jgi:hypothetical protein